MTVYFNNCDQKPRKQMACDACVWGRGKHADFCNDARSEEIKRITGITVKVTDQQFIIWDRSDLVSPFSIENHRTITL